MALADLLDAIRSEAAAAIERIGADAAREADRIVADAREEAGRARSAAASSRDPERAEQADLIRNRARLEALRHTQRSREGVFDEVLELARARLEGARERADYPALLGALVAECLAAAPDATEVHCDPRDSGLLTGIVDRHAPQAGTEPDLRTWGGVEVATGEGLVVRNTLEERLRRAAPRVRRLVGAEIPALVGSTGRAP